ncbi:hypothetical protein ASPZODRAFT_907176 [Penicilliopsis zonata CBS 506.65]|uniref:Uncharacterized protein n=1 Tax=Penicilliopsis zonata CBS 506.65 TaxID=1073090 RepID=A0A1L9S8Z5_9EURO|nr:hypothetical protein ASPZODRAFT_907176 [Penicilliopsis zonata CBS 506.65]OJJ43630.1 hypothetical protein ASPZODRAFT_907176 [Penicilliopsis zonata CBS 506.65]
MKWLPVCVSLFSLFSRVLTDLRTKTKIRANKLNSPLEIKSRTKEISSELIVLQVGKDGRSGGREREKSGELEGQNLNNAIKVEKKTLRSRRCSGGAHAMPRNLSYSVDTYQAY